MQSVDFTKTPTQVRRDIEDGLEELTRYLDASKGHKEKGTGALFHVVTILLVLLGNSIFAFWAEPSGVGPKSNRQNVQSVLSNRDSAAVSDLISRIDTNAASIDQVRNRVAPSMQIDGQLAHLRSATESLRSLLLHRQEEAPKSSK